VVLVRIVPDEPGKQPIYLYESANLPAIPERSKMTLEMDGTFLLGPGRYTADLVASDGDHRTCRTSWALEAKLGRGDKDIEPTLAPGQLMAFGPGMWSNFAAKPAGVEANGKTVTILLHAAGFSRRSTGLRQFEVSMIMSSLAAFLRYTSFSGVRIVAFNLDQQKVLYTDDDFQAGDLPQLGRVLRSLELGTVPIDVLANRRGHLDVLENLLAAEDGRAAVSDVVLFLGPTAPYWDRWKVSSERRSSLAYIQFRPFWGMRQPEFPDLLENVTKSHSGRVFRIHSPREFAAALKRLAPAS
jgi:hypothetical protein